VKTISSARADGEKMDVAFCVPVIQRGQAIFFSSFARAGESMGSSPEPEACWQGLDRRFACRISPRFGFTACWLFSPYFQALPDLAEDGFARLTISQNTICFENFKKPVGPRYEIDIGLTRSPGCLCMSLRLHRHRF